MAEWLTIQPPAPLPPIEAVRELLQRHERLRIAHPLADDDYFGQLFDALPAHYVARWADQSIIIQPGIPTPLIVAHEARLLAAARQFRQDATGLMQLLADVTGISLTTLRDLTQLKLARRSAGPLRAGWHYRLHGDECWFEHAGTGQVVEVIVVTIPEFGCLDGWFFHLYLRTTAAFQDLAAVLTGGEATSKTLAVLVRRGTLAAVSTGHSTRAIVPEGAAS
jgi:hypothetical protein